ncbi:MobF family relaxase [Acidisphaera sp. S103]|uniref:MobF family relaxase n=1 Tax=Acidisphaera sp. S103 TaxID=1747223 RepID=UPI0020B140E2|nr:MobF family relaxase [Acidisphaera sp. S103]
MSEHLLQQTLSPEMAAMAEYYHQGLSPPTPAEAAAARYAEAAGSRFPNEERLDDLVAREAGRLAESSTDAMGRTLTRGELTIRALGAFVAAGLVERDEAVASLRRTSHDQAGEDGRDAGERLDSAAERARTGKDYSSATATPRRDMNPALAERLGIDTVKALTAAEIANLLNGQRADGSDIKGKQQQAGTEGIGTIFGMDESRMPTRAELENVLAGRKVDGTILPVAAAQRALRRFQSVLGAKNAELTPAQRVDILSGRTATGGELTTKQYHERMDTSRARIGYVDLTFSAPKSVSVAWAFAPTEAERGIIHQAHHGAINSVMLDIEAQIGRARKGKAGQEGWEPGSIGWVSFDHYTARPTVEVIKTDRSGQEYTELYTVKNAMGRVAGDMQLHTHTAVFNAVLTGTGRMGGLWLDQLDGRVKEWGALYQAYLATNLRKHGVDVVLDDRTEMARLTAVPERVTEHFSKRTLGGTVAARAYAAEQGLDWDTLDADRKVGLLKQGVQDPRGAKSDDLSDAAAWQRAAAEIGYQHRSVLRPDLKRTETSRDDRLETAYQAALPVFDKELQRRASVEGADARLAAAKGLIASGVESPAEVSAITKAMRERGVMQHGKITSLIWGDVKGENGRDKVGITTALHRDEERVLVANARVAGNDRTAALTSAQIAAAVKRFPDLDFTSEHGKAQRAVMEQLGTGGRLAVAIGVAGSGKSTLLKPLVDAWKQDGRAVHGIALAWRQSDDLTEAGITASNTRAVESFLRSVETGRLQLDTRSVVVVDELGLLGTRQLNDLLRAQQAHGFQIVAIGDSKQMQSVEAGAVVDLLHRALGETAIPTLERSVRQVEQEERETTLMFRNGETAAAVQRKLENGTLRVASGGYEEAVQNIVDLWQQRREANAGRERFSISISAPTNHDAHQISRAIRDKRRALGEVGADRITVPAASGAGAEARTYDLPLAVGDRVRLFERTNARFLDTGKGGNIGRNGTVLVVAEVNAEGLVLRTKAGRDGLVKWDSLTSAANGRVRLAYGDVLTTNTGQGSTVSEHIFAVPGGSRQVNAFGAYTSGSRHREQSFIVISDGAERQEVAGRRPLGDKRQLRESDVIENVARNFARQPIKEGSLAMIARAENLRTGTVQKMQAGKQRLEQRAVEGKAKSTLAATFRSRRDDGKVRGLQPASEIEVAERRDLMQRIKDIGPQVREAMRAAAERVQAYREREVEKPTAGRRRGRRM